jgi:hypothetical protein
VDFRGGFTGLTVVAGHKKLGKSVVALRSALLAAASGWRVFYLDGENKPFIFAQRVKNFFGGASHTSWPDWMAERFTAIRMRQSMTMRHAAELVATRIVELDERVLIVVDSLNRLAKRRARGGSYFAQLQEIVDWSVTVTTESDGRCGVLLISELNRDGGAVGMDVEYASDVLLFLRDTNRPRSVSMELVSRAGPGGHLGDYVRNYAELRFDPMHDPDVSVVDAQSRAAGLREDPIEMWRLPDSQSTLDFDA